MRHFNTLLRRRPRPDSELQASQTLSAPIRQGAQFYKKLKLKGASFRLLTLLPSKDSGSPIYCQLAVAALDSNPRYRAISYTWGDPSTVCQIFINFQPFLVTENLFSALRQFRDVRVPLVFWVDAICVNQEDLIERSQQVRIMRTIYEQADETCIWLGPEADSSDKAIDLLMLLEHVMDDYQKRTKVEEQRSVLLAPLEKWNIEDGLVALGHLLKRSWWYRVWVIQEVVVSGMPIVYCGNRSLSWRTVIQGIHYLAHYQLTKIASLVSSTFDGVKGYVDGFRRVIQVDYVRNQNNPQADQLSLLHVLSQHRESEASDPRDKCVALCSLAYGADLLSRIEPYNETIQNVYIQSAHSIAANSKKFSLDFLMCAGKPRNEIVLPSWVPDWSFNEYRNDAILMHQVFSAHDQTATNAFFFSSHPSDTSASHYFSFPKDQPGTLLASGFLFDIVDGLASCETETGIIPPKANHTRYPGSTSYLDALWRTLLIDRRKELPSVVAPPHFGPVLARLMLESETADTEFTVWFKSNKNFEIYGRAISSMLHDIANSNVPRDTASREEDMEEIAIVFNVAISDRRFLILAGGYLALAPVDTLQGDVIAILRSCSVPVVLRPESGGYYKFIGTCYVHGIMQGEVMNLGLSEVEFEIR